MDGKVIKDLALPARCLFVTITRQGNDILPSGETTLHRIAGMLRGTREEAEDKVRHLLDKSRQLEKEVQQLKAKLASGQGGDLAERAEDLLSGLGGQTEPSR